MDRALLRRITAGMWIALSLLTLMPYLFRDRIAEGQVFKQVSVAETARSLERHELLRGFPARHYLEVHHEGVIPWAEEFPLYAGGAVLVHRAMAKLVPTGLGGLIPAGRWLSFGFFLLLLGGAHRLAQRLPFPGGLKYLLPAVFAWSPVFRIYAVSFMPDLPMAALCLWSIVLALEKKWIRAILIVSLACLLKYYAVYTALGLLGYAWLERREQPKARRRLAWIALGFALSILPSVAYMGAAVALGIPSAVIEYGTIRGGGHFASLHTLLSFRLYERLFTWTFVKNITPVGGALCLLAFYLARKPKSLARSVLGKFKPLWVAYVLFALMFASTYFIHDYYGLQLALLTACAAALSFSFLVSMSQARAIPIESLLLLLLSGTSFAMTRSALVLQTSDLRAADAVATSTDAEARPLVLSTEAAPGLLFNADRTGWVLDTRQIPEHREEISRLLASGKVNTVFVYLVKPWADQDWPGIADFLAKQGWSKVISLKEFDSVDPKVHSTKLWEVGRDIFQ